jgi:hypothetical protein
MAARTTPRAGRDVITLADLSPKRDIKGGSSRCVFGAEPIDTHWRTEMADVQSPKPTPPKDLEPRKPIKGGRIY